MLTKPLCYFSHRIAREITLPGADLTRCTSMPLAHISVLMSIRLRPDLKSPMTVFLFFWSIPLCMNATAWPDFFSLSANQSTCNRKHYWHTIQNNQNITTLVISYVIDQELFSSAELKSSRKIARNKIEPTNTHLFPGVTEYNSLLYN